MSAEKWKNLKISAFIDQKGTTFIKGPFDIDGNVYDYKLVDEYGEDYCTAEQMDEWFVEIVKKVKVL